MAKKIVVFKIDENMIDKFDAIARSLKLCRSELIRALIAAFIFYVDVLGVVVDSETRRAMDELALQANEGRIDHSSACKLIHWFRRGACNA